MADALHPIKVVVQRTGLSDHVIRVWERRYHVVTPKRTETNRRAYTADDIERLTLLRQLTAEGQAISFLAPLPTEQLRRMVQDAEARTEVANASAPPEQLIRQCVEAVRRLDSRALEATLAQAETQLGMQGTLQHVISPLAQNIGELWRNGNLTAAHEHFASAVLRTVLGQAVRPFAGAENAPAIVLATPGGQLHELGALIAGALACNLGWRVIYLGASLPPAEIVGAARQHRAKLVGLSLVYPEDDPRIEPELTRLRDLLPADIPILIGGRAAPAYAAVIAHIAATRFESLDEFGAYLDRLRRGNA